MYRRGCRAPWLALAVAVTAALVACATPTSGEPQASPASLVFPDTAVGQSATEQVVITNVVESGALTIESMGISGPDATMFADQFDDESSVVLQPTESTTVTVVFSPSAAGARTATLQANHSGSGPLSIPLSGTATTPDAGSTPLQASPASLSFATTAVGQSTSQDVVLRNGGASGSLTIQSAEISGPDATMFSGDLTGGSPVTLGPGNSTTVTVAFSPTASGSRSARMVVTHTGTNTPLSIPLSGEADGSAPHAVLYRINAGGPPASASPSWSEDSSASPSPYGNGGATGNAVASWGATVDLSHPSVPAGTPMQIFQSERNDLPASPDLTYSLPVPSGTPVEVRLYLAEMYGGAQVVGGRVFDVKVDGALVFRDIDVFARVGANKGLVLSAPAVSDGSVDIRFVAGVENPSVKAIEVVTTGDEVPAWLAAAPSTVEFPQATVGLTGTKDVVLTNVGTSGPLTVSSTAISGPGREDVRRSLRRHRRCGAGTGRVDHRDGRLPPVGDGRAFGDAVRRPLGGGHSVGRSPLGDRRPARQRRHGTLVRQVAAVRSEHRSTDIVAVRPDGRLYVAQRDGTIKAFTVAQRRQQLRGDGDRDDHPRPGRSRTATTTARSTPR